ncbi:MAG: quinol:electron acceptor oxidoreductase subunit ActD [Planctomycetota bacterium]
MDQETMSETKTEKTVHGMMAEFTTVDSLLAACRRIRDAGYTKTDAFTPFPVHGIDKALGIKPTLLPWIALGAGVCGTLIALAMQIWMNSIDYKYIISGKPYISLPAFIPVAFELTILLASFGAFFGMWALNGLPRFSNPLFTDPRFDRATDDRFFLYIDAKDERYDSEGVRKLFGDMGTDYINEVVDDESKKDVPKPIYLIWGLSVAASLVPLLCILTMRVTNSSSPRFHVFFDMDFSPAKDAQMTTSLFSDNRAMRPDVAGTVARGQLPESLDVLTGIDVEALSMTDSNRVERLVRAYLMDDQEAQDAEAATIEDEQSAEAGDESGEAAAETTKPSVMDSTPWIKTNPLTVDRYLLERGQQQFSIYCSTCHGMDGRGNGLVNQRAQSKGFDTWVPPSSMHQETLYGEVYPDGKLYSTISNGIRKMPGYAGQIKVKDRWAIVAYVRALQKSQNASMDLVPDSEKQGVDAAVKAAKAELERQAKEAEEAAKKREEAKKG